MNDVIRRPRFHPRPLPVPEAMAESVARLWLRHASRLPWPQRLDLVEEVDRQLIREMGRDTGQSVSALFTARLMEMIGGGLIASLPHALILLNSADPVHRRAAMAWMIVNGRDHLLECPADARPMPDERRRSQRHNLVLAGRVEAGGDSREARLVDLSRGGARLALSRPMRAGQPVRLFLPFLAAIEAGVTSVHGDGLGIAFAPCLRDCG